MTELEILVVGGGPAGLLCASFLSPNHDVGIIERSVFGQTAKYWVTTERRLARHNLSEYSLHKTRGMVISTFLGGRVRTEGDFVVVDDERLLQELVERCRRHVRVLLDSCSLVNLSWTPNSRVRVETTCGSFCARVVIDATGALSPIAKTFRLHNSSGFYAVYGGRLCDIQLHTRDIILAHVGLLGDPPPFWEVVPCGPDSAYCAIFVYSQSLIPPEALATQFHEYCRSNPFFTMKSTTEVIAPKSGAITIGRARRRQLPSVLTIGEAAVIQPPLLGTAFNEILEYTEPFCDRLQSRLRNGKSGHIGKVYRYPVLKRAQDAFQLALTRRLLRRNVEDFDRLVRLMQRLPPETVFRLCSNELTWPELLGALCRLPRLLTV